MTCANAIHLARLGIRAQEQYPTQGTDIEIRVTVDDEINYIYDNTVNPIETVNGVVISVGWSIVGDVDHYVFTIDLENTTFVDHRVTLEILDLGNLVSDEIYETYIDSIYNNPTFSYDIASRTATICLSSAQV